MGRTRLWTWTEWPVGHFGEVAVVPQHVGGGSGGGAVPVDVVKIAARSSHGAPFCRWLCYVRSSLRFPPEIQTSKAKALLRKNPAGFKTIFSRQIRKKRKLERRWRSVAAVLCFVTQFVAVSRWHRLFCARRVTSSPAGRRAASAHRVQRMGDKKFQDLSFFSFWNWCQGYVALSVYPSTNLQYFPTCLDTLLSLLGFNFKAGVGGGLAEHAAMPRTK